MLSASRGSRWLVIGIAFLLLLGVLFALFRALGIGSSEAHPSNQVLETVPVTIQRPIGSYTDLLPEAPSSTATRTRHWRLLRDTPSTPCRLWEEGTAVTSSVGILTDAWCALLGASIDGRYVHLVSGSQTICTVMDLCEQPPATVWTVYDLRIDAFRTVPTPVREGSWQAIDPVRGVGVFHGTIRSTIQEGKEDFWTVTDAAGAALWTGKTTDIDPAAKTIIGERLVSRPDGSVLFSYLAINAGRHAVFKLAFFRNGRWELIGIPGDFQEKSWRLDRWEALTRTWQATLTSMSASNTRQSVMVLTP